MPFTFDSDTTSYEVGVANDVEQTTVTATTNDYGASYAAKLGEETDEDGTVELSVGSNVVSVEVTAEDGETTRAYTVTVNRAEPVVPFTDATLSSLELSDVPFTFDSDTTSYEVSVANDVEQTTVTATANTEGPATRRSWARKPMRTGPSSCQSAPTSSASKSLPRTGRPPGPTR